jgi:hypothetical protein
METAILSAGSALVGSLIGGVSTFVGAWLSTRGQVRAHKLAEEASKREALYSEFIIEAAKRFTDAWGHQAEGPEVVATLYSAMERMRLISSGEVLTVAQKVVRAVIEAYAAPNRSFDEARTRLGGAGSEDERLVLRDFSEACRAELAALRN